jgi:hypothetical protein
VERVKQAKPEADACRRNAESAAKIAQHLSNQGTELVVVNISHVLNPLRENPVRMCPAASTAIRPTDQFGRSTE